MAIPKKPKKQKKQTETKRYRYPKDTTHSERVERGRILSLDKWWGALVVRHGKDRARKKRLPKDDN